HLPIVGGTPGPDAIQAVRQAGLRVLAADGGARRALGDLHRDGLLGPGARAVRHAAGPRGHGTGGLFGNEASGLPAHIRSLADEAVAVPIYGRAESLNLAAAAAVCLYGSARAQRPH